MSFLDIKDPEKRDVMIADYLAVKKRLKDRNLHERGELMNRRRDFEENVVPVVASNKQMARNIVDELVPLTRELRELNNKGPRRPKFLVFRELVLSEISSLNHRVKGNWSLLMDLSPKLFSRSTRRYNIWYPIR